MTQSALAPTTSINGFNLQALGDVVEQITADPRTAVASFRVRSRWQGGTRVESRVAGYELGGQKITRQHVIQSDEPRELFGTDTAPNPQELLFAALNACMIFGYAAGAAAMSIEVEELSIETHGSLDVRGSFGIGEVPPGMDAMHYTVRIRARATAAQLEELHAAVMAKSANRYHIAHAIPLVPKLVIEQA